MIAVVDYGAGNLASVKNALDYLSFESEITADPEKIAAAERVIFPGVGAAGASMSVLKKSGLDRVLRGCVAAGTPVLGICVGCQVILEYSAEDGGVDCLGLLLGVVEKFDDPEVTVPHMGWNQVHFEEKHPLFSGLENDTNFYFVHSYYPIPEKAENIFARTEYGRMNFASVIGKNNLVATQFHLEKSGEVGLKVLRNFCSWDGKIKGVRSC